MTAEVDRAVQAGAGGAGIRPLRPEDVGALRLGPHQRVGDTEVHDALRRRPGRSVWAPEWREFLLVAPWRNRDEISVVQTLAAVVSAEPLVAEAIRRCREAGDALLLLVELDDVRHPAFYRRTGLDLLQEVVALELDRPRPMPSGDALRFVRFDPADEPTLRALLALDQAAFPWLWWNSELEFRSYALTPGVEAYLGLCDGRPVSYVGLTAYGGWGHVDRLAVWPDLQGSGLGRATLGYAVGELARRGARRIGLSTQSDNARSLRLYERFGFGRAPELDYRLYGARLAEPALGLPARLPAHAIGRAPFRERS